MLNSLLSCSSTQWVFDFLVHPIFSHAKLVQPFHRPPSPKCTRLSRAVRTGSISRGFVERGIPASSGMHPPFAASFLFTNYLYSQTPRLRKKSYQTLWGVMALLEEQPIARRNFSSMCNSCATARRISAHNFSRHPPPDSVTPSLMPITSVYGRLHNDRPLMHSTQQREHSFAANTGVKATNNLENASKAECEQSSPNHTKSKPPKRKTRHIPTNAHRKLFPHRRKSLDVENRAHEGFLEKIADIVQMYGLKDTLEARTTPPRDGKEKGLEQTSADSLSNTEISRVHVQSQNDPPTESFAQIFSDEFSKSRTDEISVSHLFGSVPQKQRKQTTSNLKKMRWLRLVNEGDPRVGDPDELMWRIRGRFFRLLDGSISVESRLAARRWWEDTWCSSSTKKRESLLLSDLSLSSIFLIAAQKGDGELVSKAISWGSANGAIMDRLTAATCLTALLTTRRTDAAWLLYNERKVDISQPRDSLEDINIARLFFSAMAVGATKVPDMATIFQDSLEQDVVLHPFAHRVLIRKFTESNDPFAVRVFERMLKLKQRPECEDIADIVCVLLPDGKLAHKILNEHPVPPDHRAHFRALKNLCTAGRHDLALLYFGLVLTMDSKGHPTSSYRQVPSTHAPEFLGSIRRVGEEVLSLMVEEFAQADKLEYAIMFHEIMAIAGWTSNRALYSLFKMFLRKRNVYAAVVCYTELKSGGFKFNLKQYTSALSACSHTRNTEVALELWKRMREDHIVPDSIAYHSMFATLLNGNAVDTAVKLYNRMLEAFEKRDGANNEAAELQSNTSHFLNTYAQHLLREGNVRELAAHITKVGPLGIAPDEATISMLVSHHTKRGEVITALKFASVVSRHAKFSQDHASHPRMVVDCAILRACAQYRSDSFHLTNEQRSQFVDEIVGKMIKNRVLPDLAMWTALMAAYRRMEEHDKVDLIWDSLMEKYRGSKSATKRSILLTRGSSDHCAASSDTASLRRILRELWRPQPKNAFQWKPDNHSFGIYIKSTLLRVIPKDDAVHEGYGVGRQVSDIRLVRDPAAVKAAVDKVKSMWLELADDGMAMDRLTWRNTLTLLSATASFQDAAELVIDGFRRWVDRLSLVTEKEKPKQGYEFLVALGADWREGSLKKWGVGPSAQPVVDASAVEILVGHIGRYREFGAAMMLTTQLQDLRKELLRVKVKSKGCTIDEEDFRACETMMRNTVGGLSKFLDAWKS
ncbi:hypothetical protein BJ742DRAFT_421181 [Cladochytrium replicatum]|nr:hypothetical protein BJ742DRAFT_421181 [Cladochytrium replicatum]